MESPKASWEKQALASGPHASFVSVTRGTQNQPRSPHLSSLAECFLTSPAWAAAPAQTPASDKFNHSVPNGIIQCEAVSVLGNVLLTTSSVPWYIICSRQRSTTFVEAACTTAGCQTGGVANVTTLDSAPVGQAPPSSSIPLPLPCPSNGMLPSNPTTCMSSLPTPCTIESPALSPSQRCGHLLRRGILFYQINSVMTDFLEVKLHGGLPSWLIFDVGSGPAVVGSNSTRTFNDAPDGFDAVSVQNVGSTYIIVSWDLPTHSNGILINFSLYCNGIWHVSCPTRYFYHLRKQFIT
ncbi:hypothetical protein EMCRGX_G012255 [Ephydatia muelleri]